MIRISRLCLLVGLGGALLFQSGVAPAQCLLGRLGQPPRTYSAGYPVGMAYLPTTTYTPVVSSPVATVTAYRVTYLPASPGPMTVYRPAPSLAPPVVSTTSYLPVVTPYAVASPVTSPGVVPVTTYRPVQIVYEPRRLFNWRPFENLRQRRAGYWPVASSPTWTTAYFASPSFVPVASSEVVCSPGESVIPMTASLPTSAGGCVGCTSGTSTTWPSSAASTIPTLPSASPAPSTGPTPTFAPQSSTGAAPSKPADAGSWTSGSSQTGVPVSQEKPLVRQAVFEKPIPLVDEDSTDPPLVEIHGWRRAQ